MWVVRPAEGGILQHLQQLSEGISDFEIVVVAPPDLQEWAGKRRFIPLNLMDGLKPREDLEAVRKLRRILGKEKAHIVHAHGLKAALITASALFWSRRQRFVFTAHNSLPDLQSFPLGQWISAPVQRWLFGGMDTIISVSDSVRAQILRYAPGEKVRTIHNGISASSFGQISVEESRVEAGLQPNDLVVGTVARLIPAKGIATLLEAVSLIAKILPNLKLVIVGDGPERQKLEAYAEGLGLAERAVFLGQREDVPRLMAGWNCFALPSLSEGFNISVLEAMASRLPVVASDLPALREAVMTSRGGFLVLAGSAPDFAAALLHVLKAPEKARSMGDFNRERVDSVFAADRMVRCVRALYEGFRD